MNEQIRGNTALKVVGAIAPQDYELPKYLEEYRGIQIGTPAAGDKVSVKVSPHECQREFVSGVLSKYIEKGKGLDWDLFGHITVVRYPDGSMEHVDGGHRLRLVQALLPELKEVPAHIIDVQPCDAITKPPKIFAYLNGELTKRVSNEDRFRSLVLAQDSDALDALKWLKRAELYCGRVNQETGKQKVKYRTFTKCLDLGKKQTVEASLLIQNHYDRWNDAVFHALVFLMTRPEVKDHFADVNSNTFRDFCEFFRVSSDIRGIKDWRMLDYREQVSQWELGTAYGIWKSFCHWAKKQGLKAYKLGTWQDRFDLAKKSLRDNDDNDREDDE
jgi:hypothetical protein